GSASMSKIVHIKPSRAGAKSVVRLLVVVLFAVVTAGLLFSVAQATLQWLYNFVTTHSGTGGAQEYHPIPLGGYAFGMLGVILGAWLGTYILRRMERLGLKWD